MRKAVVVSLVALALGGCGTINLSDDKQNQLIVQSAGDVGAIGCVLIKTEGSVDDLSKARLSVKAAKVALTEPNPSFVDIYVAFAQGLPPNYASLATVMAQRVMARLNDAEVIAPGTLAYDVALAFLDACELSLS